MLSDTKLYVELNRKSPELNLGSPEITFQYAWVIEQIGLVMLSSICRKPLCEFRFKKRNYRSVQHSYLYYFVTGFQCV